MKTAKISLALAFCLLCSAISFATPSDARKNQKLRKEVAKLIEAPKMQELGITTTHAFVNFSINEANEIVVLNVVAETEQIEQYVRKELNERKIRSVELEAGIEYNLRVTFLSVNSSRN